MQRGFSTIEMMIAMTIMIIVLSAVVVVSFGNQSFLVGSQISSEAMSLAQEMLESQQALARKDFNLVNPVASTTQDIYEKAVYVKLLPDFLTKEVKSIIAWKNERNATSTLELTTLIANFETPVGANTCNSTLSGNWQSPLIANAPNTDFGTLVGDPGGIYTLGDIDAYKGRVYVVAANTSVSNKETFFVFDSAKLVSDPNNALLGKIDNAPVLPGFNAVRVSEDPASSPLKTYAYAASAASSNYTTCNPVTSLSCGQLGIIDVSLPVLSGWAPQMTNLMLASSTAPLVKGNQARGNSLFFKNGYLLLGLTSTGVGNGPELHVIDVHTPSLALLFNPIQKHIIYPLGSLSIGNSINSIAMRGSFIYVVTPNSQELQIASTSNPANLVLVGSFNSSTGSGNGKSAYLLGDKLYLGKTTGAGFDFHILNNTNPAAVLSELVPGISGKDIEPPVNSINGLIVRDYLSFLLTNSDLKIYRTDNPTSITSWGSAVLPASGHATEEPSFDCEGNNLYITSNDVAGRGYLSVITSTP